MKALLSSASLACSVLLCSSLSAFFLSEQGFVPFSNLLVLLLGFSQSEVPYELPLHQLCTLPSSHLDLGLGFGVMPSMRSGFGVSGL